MAFGIQLTVRPNADGSCVKTFLENMLLILLIFAVSCLLLLFYSRWIVVKRYWKERGVPHLPPHPLVGNLTFLLRLNPGIWMRMIYEKFKTPYIGIWLFWRPALVVNCPELARNILVKDSANFRNKFMSSGNSDPIGSLNILLIKEPKDLVSLSAKRLIEISCVELEQFIVVSVYRPPTAAYECFEKIMDEDPVWTKLRKHFSSVFTSSKLKNVLYIAKSKSNELTRRVDQEMQNGFVDVRMMLTDYTTDVFGISSFGVASNATLTGTGALRKITKEFMQYNFYRGMCWGSIFFWPELVDIFRFKFTPKSTTEYFKKAISDIIVQYGETKNAGDAKTLLEALLQLKDKDLIDKDVNIEDFTVAQAALFLIGGFDSTGTSLTFVTYRLAFYPEEQEIIYQELLAAKEKHGKEFLSYDNLHKQVRLDCVIKETVRLQTPMGWLDRAALNDYKVDDNLTIKAGTPVYINANGMQMDPEFFPEPDKFDPSRFLPENESKIKPFTYLPFGDGPRMCIGMRFAQLTMKTALSAFILNYKIEPIPGSPRPDDIKIESKNMFYFPRETLKLKFVPREQNGDRFVDV